jgi:hypothetical protein
MTDTTLNKDIADLVNRIDSMPDGARTAILNGLLTAKAERQKAVVKKTFTTMQAAAADHRNPVLLRQISATCARHGYEIPANDHVSLKDLDAALKASGADIDMRFRIKDALATLNLI